MLEVSFVRRRGSRDRVYVSRADGTSTGWDFPSYGDGLPHDLCHLVVEDELQLTEGFWGLVDQGVEVGLVNNEVTLMRDGKPYAEQAGVDLEGLMQAEACVAALGSPTIAVELAGGLAVARLDPTAGEPEDRALLVKTAEAQTGTTLPASATPGAIASIGRRLRELAKTWIEIEDGKAITLPFPSERSRT